MARFLKQSTAFTFRIGPFLDDTDGKTAETGLTIAQADIQISKNGGAFAQTSASPTTTHDADGWYQCPLTATDTGTLGPLTVQVLVSGALPVWEHFMVVPANVYDSLVGGSDTLQADVTQVSGSAVAGVADFKADVSSLATAANLATVDTVVDAIKAVTDLLPDAGALSSLATAANLATVDTVVDAIKAVTDNLPDSGALTSLSTLTLAQLRTALGTNSSDQCAELSVAAPSATPSVAAAIMLLYMAARNQVTATSSEKAIYNDAGTKIAKKTISDDGTTYTESEAVAGNA